jgi:hypothetical protein
VRADELLSRAGGWRVWRWVVLAALATPALLLWLSVQPISGGPSRTAGDQAHLKKIYSMLVIQQQRSGLPTEGGHRLLTNLWTRGVIEPSTWSLESFFAPGRAERDPHFLELKEKVERGERIWTDGAQTSSRDTHYAALATPFLDRLFDKDQVIAADDCEDGWPFAALPGLINVLYGDGRVREMRLDGLPVFGPDSPTPELRCLER